MIRTKKIIIALFVLAIFSCVSSASAQSSDENFWIGKYEYEDGGGKVVEDLEVKRKDGKLTAVYRAVITAQLTMYFSLTVEVKGNTAFFYYDQCLSKEGDEDFDGYDPYPCEEDTNKQGDLMFKLVKSTRNSKKPVILTYAVNFEDVDQVDHIFFEKLK